ncbi:uncharacterized protein QC763_504670 [Podospora pseudopauciseta]|uniref:Uncharacterized protein n=2 Tax=Podospora TaxID=5144 RepID=A0ABR0H8X2_9PEZI|nr:hypothetical protein QC763_504670 [Podospora pseudopauciseta]KAK4675491.1 hypothetical protein QC764_504670 [Podospora pseudoanserina]
MEWTKTQYNTLYETWVPYLEDLYLRYFTRDNKASYTTKENLDKTKVTGISQVDTLQDNIHTTASSQLGQDGLGRPVGDLLSREGVNRLERKGKDGQGGYVPGGNSNVVSGAGNTLVGGAVEGGKTAGSGVVNGGKAAVGWFGLGKKEQK